MPPSDAFDHPIRLVSGDGTDLAAYDLAASELGGTAPDGIDGPDVLLVHATGLCAGVWAPMAAHLDGLRVAALDVRGHGRSAPPPSTMHWRGTAQDVLAAVDGLDLDRPVGVGHSMGGASLLLAEQARPGTFAALWLFEPIVFPPGTAGGDDDDNPMVQGALRRRDTFPSAEAALVNFGAKPPLSELHPDALEAYVRWGFAEQADGSVTLRCRPGTEADTFRHGARHDAWEHLGEVGCPVVVLRGRPERWGPAALAPGIADAIPGAVLEEHPELGHFGPLEDPEAMAGSVLALVSKVSPQRSP